MPRPRAQNASRSRPGVAQNTAAGNSTAQVGRVREAAKTAARAHDKGTLPTGSALEALTKTANGPARAKARAH